jgi:hypothetical protein
MVLWIKDFEFLSGRHLHHRFYMFPTLYAYSVVGFGFGVNLVDFVGLGRTPTPGAISRTNLDEAQ